MSHHYTLDFDKLNAAADAVDQMIDMNYHLDHDPDSPRVQMLQRRRLDRERDQVLERQMSDKYNSSLVVEPTHQYERPPLYSQIQGLSRQQREQMRQDEVLARQVQDQYDWSLAAEPSYRQERPSSANSRRGHVRPDDVFARRMQKQYDMSPAGEPEPERSKHSFDSARQMHHPRRQEAGKRERERMMARQLQDQYNWSLAAQAEYERDQPEIFVPRHQHHDHHVSRQLRDQYNASLAAEPSTREERPPPRYSQLEPQYGSGLVSETRYNMAKQWGQPYPEHERPVSRDSDRTLLVADAPEKRVKWEDEERRRRKKRGDIKAKDYKEELRWLAGRRPLGKK